MILSGRAETDADIIKFSRKFFCHDTFYIEGYTLKTVALTMGEFAFEVEGDFTEEQILELLRKQNDSHVMIQTLGEGRWNEREDRLVRNYNKE